MLAVWRGLASFVTVICGNLLGDGLQDDPRPAGLRPSGSAGSTTFARSACNAAGRMIVRLTAGMDVMSA
jgi:hypothetical protein